MKILHVFGGLRTFRIASWQARHHLDIHKLTLEDPQPFGVYYEGTNLTLHQNSALTNLSNNFKGKKFLGIRLHLLLYLIYIGLIGRLAKQIEPDVIHCYRHTGAFVTVLAKKLYGLKSKIVFDYQDPWVGEEFAEKSIFYKALVSLFYAIERILVRRADFIVTQGPKQINLLIARHKVSAKKFAYTLNTVDPNFFKSGLKSRRNLRKKLGLTGTAILYLGSIINYYGVHIIPAAAKDIVRAHPNTKFVMLGIIKDEAYWRAIKNKIKQFGLEKNFVEAYPEKRDMPKYISACDIGLITHLRGSKICEVAIPTKLFEYMACGLAIVTSNMKHLTQFVVPEKCGAAFEPNNATSLANVLKKLVANKQRIKSCGTNARKAVETKYNWNAEMEKLIKVYQTLLEGTKNGCKNKCTGKL